MRVNLLFIGLFGRCSGQFSTHNDIMPRALPLRAQLTYKPNIGPRRKLKHRPELTSGQTLLTLIYHLTKAVHSPGTPIIGTRILSGAT